MIKLVSQRLDFARQVALYKWQNSLPVEDLKQEQTLMTSIINQTKSLNLNLSDAFVVRFFTDQFNASKIIQVGFHYPSSSKF